MRTRVQRGLGATAATQQVSEAVTLTIPGVVTNVTASLVTDRAVDRSPDQALQVEVIVRVRRDVLPTPLPVINKTHLVQVTGGGTTVTYSILRFAPDNGLLTVYRLELRRTPGVVYG